MDKKIFASELRLVKAKTGWYIHYIDEFGKRQRPTFNLNRIANLKDRERRANEIIKLIKSYQAGARKGKSPEPAMPKIRRGDPVNIRDAITAVYKIKSDSDRKHTIKTYRTMYRKLIRFIGESDLESLPIEEFRIPEARRYMEWVKSQKKISNTTYNNCLAFAREFWCEMIRQEYVAANPFSKLKMKKAGQKVRRNFNEEERQITIRHIQNKHQWLYLACLLQYYCFLRPSELLRLKFSNINLKRGVILIYGHQAKNWRDATITLPDFLIRLLEAPEYSQYPDTWYVFGTGLKPSAARPAKDDQMNKLHRKYMNELHRSGQLRDIRGLTFYSWKDTGCTDAAEFLTPFELRDQLRHKSLDMVMRYYHGKQIIQAVKKHPISLL